jgi:hypothetical protein
VGEHGAVGIQQHGPDRDIVRGQRETRLGERGAHRILVMGHPDATSRR